MTLARRLGGVVDEMLLRCDAPSRRVRPPRRDVDVQERCVVDVGAPSEDLPADVRRVEGSSLVDVDPPGRWTEHVPRRRLPPVVDGSTWRALPSEGAPSPRYVAASAFTVEELLVVGGEDQRSLPVPGASAYAPSLDRWRPLPAEGSPDRRSGVTSTWAGDRLFVLGGSEVKAGKIAFSNEGAVHLPAEDRWRPIAARGTPSARADTSAVFTGRDVIIWGGQASGSFLASGAIFDVAADRWRKMSAAGAPRGRAAHRAIWTGAEMIVLGGFTKSLGATLEPGRYRAADDRWLRVSTTGAPRDCEDAVWTGRELFVLDDGLFSYEPVQDRWEKIAPHTEALRWRADAGSRCGAQLLWTGREVVAWGLTLYPGAYDPATRSWRRVSEEGAPAPRMQAIKAWTGHELLVWGGLGRDEGLLGDGGRLRFAD